MNLGMLPPLTNVTPFAGVWIEITQLLLMYLHTRVTPFAGVWIEIFSAPPPQIKAKMSLPSRECGLKLAYPMPIRANMIVTPFAGVWIEMCICLQKSTASSSLPSRECGLKYHSTSNSSKYFSSLPSRECGLKLCSFALVCFCLRHSLRGSVD